jgi:hypothetical protein
VLSRVIVKKRRGRRALAVLSLTGIIVGTLLIGNAVLAVNATGAFELDGNATNASGTPGDDWDNVCHQVLGTDCSTSNNTTGATAVSWIDAADDPIIFTGGGSKDPQDPQNSWLWKPSDTIPDKDTINHAFAAKYSLAPDPATCPVPAGTTTCDVIFFGSDRFDNAGDAQLGFWFFKNAVTRTNTASNGGFKFDGHHANGDLLVISDFSNGGTTSTIKIYFWDTSCGSDNTAANKIYSNPAVGQCGANNLRLHLSSDNANCSTATATAAACGIVNTANDTASPWPFLDKTGHTSYQQGEFYEAGVNLSNLGLGGTCFASFEAESRASTSPTATLKALAIGGFGACTSGLVTTPSAGKGGTVQIGSNGTYSATDSATLTITGVSSWSGTLKFFFCGPLATGSCDGTTNVGTQVGSDRTVTNTDTQPFVSDAKVITAAGRYCWRAEFTATTTGVPNASDGSTDECFTVTKRQPSYTSTPIVQIKDTVTVSGLTSNATGDLHVGIYTDSGCTTRLKDASNVDIPDATFAISNTSFSTTFIGVAAGSYYYKVSYAGDSNNLPFSSCEESVTATIVSK